MDETNSLNRAAKIISVIFHPLFMPLYGLILLMFSIPAVYNYFLFSINKILLLIILINNTVLPLSLLVFLKMKNQISSREVESRKERMLLLFFATILYAITSYIVIKYPVPNFIKTYFIGIFFVASSITVINNWWKISIYAAGAGMLTALMLMLSLQMYHVMILPLIAVIIAAGLILSSRLRLNSHTPAQAWIGFLLGFIELCILYRMII